MKMCKGILLKSIVMSLIFFVFLPISLASNKQSQLSVTGHWETIDGKTQKPSSIVAIQKQGAFYIGKVIKTFRIPGEKAGVPYCVACRGNQKNKPIMGLEIIQGMICRLGYCHGGTILDPRNGNIYHATMRLIDAGKKLRVRGYVGLPVFGKTVMWNRVVK